MSELRKILGSEVPVLRLDDYRNHELGVVVMVRRAADLYSAGKNKIVVDFDKVIHINSGTVGTLLGLQKRLRELGGNLYFARVPKEVLAFLSILNLEGMLKGSVVEI